MKRAFVILLAVGVLWAGCGSDSDDAPPSSNKAQASCSSIADKFCQKYQECLSFTFSAAFESAERCALGVKLSCEEDTKAPGSKTSASTFVGCANDLLALSCDDFRATLLQGSNRQAACKPVPGELADGAACYSSTQCASTSCVKPGDATCGTCKALAKSGEKCDGSTPCGDDLFCNQGTCAATKGSGQACQTSSECQSGLSCQKDVCGTPAPLKEGAACGNGEGSCDFFTGLGCHPTKNVCAKVKLVGAGEACGLVGEDLVGCLSGGDCVEGKCVAAAKDGEACKPTSEGGAGCQSPAECEGGTCKLPSAPTCQ